MKSWRYECTTDRNDVRFGVLRQANENGDNSDFKVSLNLKPDIIEHQKQVFHLENKHNNRVGKFFSFIDIQLVLGIDRSLFGAHKRHQIYQR